MAPPPLPVGGFTTVPVDGRNPNREYSYTSTTASAAPSPADQLTPSLTGGPPTSTSPSSATRTWAGPLTTVFKAPDACYNRDYAILPPSIAHQQAVFAVYEGGRCRENNDCLPWHDRPATQGFFSPAFY